MEVGAERLEDAFQRVMRAREANVHPDAGLRDVAGLERAWWRETVRQTFRAADGSARFDDFEDFFEGLFVHYGSAAAWCLADGAEKILGQLAERGLARAIVSNFDHRLRPLLRELGIHDAFRAITLPSDAGAAKPDRAIFDACLKRLGLPGHRTLYLGDRAVEDVQAARTAGMHAMDVGDLATLAELPDALSGLEDTLA